MTSCNTEGYSTMQFYYFNGTKSQVEKDLLRVINLYTDTIPTKWKGYAVPFDFMDDRFVYFKNNPEEILRVGFPVDTINRTSKNSTKFGLFGLFKGNKWIFNRDISSNEKERIKKRLETEIFSKMKYQFRKD